MNIRISRSVLLKAILNVMGAVERRHTLPILSNILFCAKDGVLTLTATDLEIELVTQTDELEILTPGSTTVPAKKISDILRSLPDTQPLLLTQGTGKDDGKLTLKQAGRKYAFQTLPASDYPNLENWEALVELPIPADQLLGAMENTASSMANQDVRYYLNGMLFDMVPGCLVAVTTDGHRMSMSKLLLDDKTITPRGAILPRKSVGEVTKLLSGAGKATITLKLGNNNLRIIMDSLTITSKLIDGRFPEYRRVIPKNNPVHVEFDRAEAEGACARAFVMSNEKYRGARFSFSGETLTISANNSEHETAEETVQTSVVQGELSVKNTIDIGFNLTYMLDVLRTIKTEKVMIELFESTSSALVYGAGDDAARFVLMPMKL